MEFFLSLTTEAQSFVIQVAALGTNLVSHTWRSVQQEGWTPPWECFLPGTPLVLHREQRGHQAPLTTEQDKSSSHGRNLAKRIPMEVGVAAGSSAQHWEALPAPQEGADGWGSGRIWWITGSWTRGGHGKQQGLRASWVWEQNIWEYTHRLYKECHVLYKSPLVIYTWPRGSPGRSSALRRLRLRLELFASQDLLIK